MKVRVLLDGRMEEMDLPESVTITDLLDRLGLEREAYWVARNRAMLHKADCDKITLAAGDNVEIFRIMSGG